jgi:Fibronectin type III domain
MKTLISGCMDQTMGQARFGPRSCATIAMMALLLTTANLMAQPVVNTLGGGSLNKPYYGKVDGNTLHAKFHTPIGLAINSSRNYLYVADRDNNAIRKLDLVGNQTYTFVPNAFVPTNLISQPVGVAVDSSDNVLVLNRGNGNNGTVLEFDPLGNLIATNATGLINAAGIAMDYTDNIYVTVQSNKLIRIAAGTTNQTTIATIAIAGTSLKGIVVKYNGLIAACDSGRNGILLIDPNTSVITTNAGFNGAGDNTNAAYQFDPPNGVLAAKAKFNQPYGVAEVGDGGLIVTDCGNNRVKVVNAAGVVTNLYGVNSNLWYRGSGSHPGWLDGNVVVPDVVGDVESRQPVGVCFSSDGTVYTTEDYYHIIRHVTEANFPPLPPPPPAAPMNLTATATSGQVILTWTASLTATNYNVKRSITNGGPYTIIGSTPSTTYTDTNVLNGTTYYYVVSAVNAGGQGPNSAEVSATPPIPPPPAPRIGWFDYEGPPPNQTTVLHPVSGANYYTANNDLLMAIDPGTNGLSTYYIATNGPQPVLAVPSSTNGSTPPPYQDGWSYAQPLPVTTMPDLVIKAVNVGPGGTGQIATAEFLFQVANPTIIGANAAQFTVSDITSGAQLWYTTDGSDPTNAAPSQSAGTITGTNDITLSLPLPDNTNMTFKVRGFRDGYSPSGIAVQSFSSSNFVPNTISFGFASGEASSDFVGSPGQTFYAPVTLSVLPDQTIYSLQFNVTVTNVGSAPLITPGAFNFESMLMKPIPGVTPVIYESIPPAMFVSTNPVPNWIMLDGSTNFSSLLFTDTSLNLLGVGWLERAGHTNLYDTTTQDLITYSMAHDVLHLSKTGLVEVGGYAFSVPVTATNGQTYQIQIGRPSATSDGIGTPGSSVFIYAPTNGSLGGGTVNSIKIVTMGQRKYIVGNVYPFRWFNAGDFGNTNLQNADVMQVFESAIYSWNYPPWGSDFFDAMDSCGNIGVTNGSGIYTNTAIYPILFTYSITNYTSNYDATTNLIDATSNVLSITVPIYIDTISIPEVSTNTYTYPTATNVALVTTTYTPPANSYWPNLFDVAGNDQNINQIVFGDGRLDVCDVYVTFRRSLDSSLWWFQRFWATNGVRVAEKVPNVVHNVMIKSAATPQPKVQDGISSTNSPKVDFAGGDCITPAGQTVSIPITANIFGDYPLRVLMLNLTVVPLDGSPPLTTQVQFAPSAALGAPTSGFTANDGGPGNYAAAWLDNSIAGLTGNVNLGTLTVTIPTNATSSSAYAVHFDHASASPNGLASFPKQTLTGLITLSNRSGSHYNDGIPDSWRLRYFGTIYNLLSVSNACPTGDGVDNWEKYVAGVDPNTPDDFPSLNPKTPAPAGATAAIHWPSVAGKQYVILRSSSLFNGSWTAIATNTGTGTDMEFDDAINGMVYFYRVQVLP